MDKIKALIHEECKASLIKMISQTYANEKMNGEMFEYQFIEMPITLSCLYEDRLYEFGFYVNGGRKDFRLQFTLNLSHT